MGRPEFGRPSGSPTLISLVVHDYTLRAPTPLPGLYQARLTKPILCRAQGPTWPQLRRVRSCGERWCLRTLCGPSKQTLPYPHTQGDSNPPRTTWHKHGTTLKASHFIYCLKYCPTTRCPCKSGSLLASHLCIATALRVGWWALVGLLWRIRPRERSPWHFRGQAWEQHLIFLGPTAPCGCSARAQGR